jgi:hypothetical protein
VANSDVEQVMGNSGDTILNYFGRLEKLLGRILHRQKPGRLGVKSLVG